EQSFGELFIRVDASTKLFDIDVLVWCMCHMNRARAEKEWLPPIREQRNVRRIGNGQRLETGHSGEALRPEWRAELDIGMTLCPVENHLLDRSDVAHQPEHDFGFRV